MKTLKNNIYKNIASILSSDSSSFKSAKNLVMFTRILSSYPSKSIYYFISERILHFSEQNIHSISLILETMRDEGEDEEIINNIELLRKNPTITTSAEVERLCRVLSDYIKYEKILKVKNSFIQALDMLDDDDAHIHENIETLYNISTNIVSSYNTFSYQTSSSTFDPCDVDGMKMSIAEAKDARSADKVIITGIRALNNLLAPGYLPGSLYVYAALPGNYKSGILLQGFVDVCKFNEHIKNTTNGKTPVVIYISMENTMGQTIRRLWSLLYPNADMNMFSVDEISEMIDSQLCEKGFRPIILYYGYREKSTADIANIIRQYNDDSYVVEALFFDYIKRVRPARTDAAATASEKAELNAVMNEFKLMSAQFNIPIITAHQLNRQGAAEVDALIAKGGYNNTASVLGRSQISVAWEVMEVADGLFIINIENDGETKRLMIKEVKRREIDANNIDVNIVAIQHPFLSPDSFALKLDIMETVSVSMPIYTGRRQTNYMANI